MKWIVTIFLLLLLMCFLSLFLKLTIVIRYKHKEDDDRLTITFRTLFGILSYRVDVPVIRVAENAPAIVTEQKITKQTTTKEKTKHYTIEDLLNQLHNFKELVTHIVNLHTIIRSFFKKVVVKRFNWHSMIGIGDAAHTGILTGAFWTVKGGLIGLIGHLMRMENQPELSITPNFQQMVSQTYLECMFQFRIGHAMLAGLKLFKYWKGGIPRFKGKSMTTSFVNEKTIN